MSVSFWVDGNLDATHRFSFAICDAFVTSDHALEGVDSYARTLGECAAAMASASETRVGGVSGHNFGRGFPAVRLSEPVREVGAFHGSGSLG